MAKIAQDSWTGGLAPTLGVLGFLVAMGLLVWVSQKKISLKK